MLLVLTVTTEQQWGSPTTVANVSRLNNSKEGLAVTHDDLSRVSSAGNTRKYPENPGICGFYPDFLSNSDNSNKQ